MTELEQRAACIAECVSWIATPFVNNARVKGAGVACGPLLIAAYVPLAVDTGRMLPMPSAFSRDWFFHTREEKFLSVVEKFCISVDLPEPGDLAMFRLGAEDRPYSHGAVVINWPHRVVHAMWRVGVEYADATQPPLRRNSGIRFYSPWGFAE